VRLNGVTGVVLLCTALILPRGLYAQHATATRLGVSANERARAQAGPGAYAGESAHSAELVPRRVVHHGLIGAGIGGFVGLTAAFITTHREAVKDHSEDALIYILDTATGIVAGFTVGVIVAYVWK